MKGGIMQTVESNTEKDRWSESASANGCKDYKDKYAKYKAGSAK